MPKWKEILKNYSISDNGEVRNDRTGRILKQLLNPQGYYYLNIRFNKKEVRIKPHKEVAKAFLEDYSESLHVDHIDRNPRNNNLSNLRMCTRSQNQANRKGMVRSSIYKGVSWRKDNNVWRSDIQKDGKRKTIGYFKSETMAALAYDEMAVNLFGKFACTNKSLGLLNNIEEQQ